VINDITILYITACHMPASWLRFQLKMLFKAIGETKIICVGRTEFNPIGTGTYLIDKDSQSYWNIYMQMLKAAKFAKTDYVAMVEDDTLYSKEHFTEFRPGIDEVSYNRSRWSLFVWDPIYCLRQRISNCSLIAGREYLIDALEERKEKLPNGADNTLAGEVGRPDIEKRMKVSRRNRTDWFSSVPIIQLNHPSGQDERQKAKWKKHGQIKAYDIPYWGKSKDIGGKYNDAN
jgi:hypothetical protein